jgi:hypothetical protein
MAWAKNGTPDTLTSASATLTISDLTSTIFNVNLTHTIPSSAGAGNVRLRYGYNSIDTGSNYSSRESNNGGADTSRTSQTNIIAQINNNEFFHVYYTVNIATEEKLLICFFIDNGTTGAGTAPARGEVVGKWVNTSNQYNQTQVYTTSSTKAVGSNLSALGTD